MIDSKVDDAIWVVHKLLQGIVKFVIIRTRLRVECIKVMNLPFMLVDKSTSITKQQACGHQYGRYHFYDYSPNDCFMDENLGLSTNSPILINMISAMNRRSYRNLLTTL
jgi:hypothetical protein